MSTRNSPTILFRECSTDHDTRRELEIARKHFPVVTLRSECPSDSLIIGRYSVLPYYAELTWDLANLDSDLINSRKQHKWIANFEYYDKLKDYTFPTWTDDDFHTAPEGPYVVKGRTNSRKHQWNTQMYAASKKEAARVASELANDFLIGPQGVLYRQYVPLETYEVGINGLPFTNEWRVFCLGNNILSSGYYWSNARDIPTEPPRAMLGAAQHIANIAANYVNFFVLDLARTEKKDGWILVEINDAQMSGLSCNDPEVLYSNLAKVLRGEKIRTR